MTDEQVPKAEPSAGPDPDDSPLEGSSPYVLLKPVNLAQLDAEISTATGAENLDVVLTGPDDPNQLTGPSNPAVLWLRPSNLDNVQGIIDAHNPDPQWGVPQVMKDYGVVWAKLQADPEAKLTPTEVRTLAVGVAFQLNAAQQTGTASTQ